MVTASGARPIVRDPRGNRDLRAHRVHGAHLELEGSLAQMEHPVPQENVDSRVCPDPLDLQDNQDLAEMPDPRAQLDLAEKLELP